VLLANVHVGGIPRSFDRGATWQPTIDTDSDVHEVRAHPTRPGLVVAAAAIGLCISMDGGATWEIEQTGLHASYCSAVGFADDDILVAAATDHFAPLGAIYRRAVDEHRPLVKVAGRPAPMARWDRRHGLHRHPWLGGRSCRREGQPVRISRDRWRLVAPGRRNSNAEQRPDRLSAESRTRCQAANAQERSRIAGIVWSILNGKRLGRSDPLHTSTRFSGGDHLSHMAIFNPPKLTFAGWQRLLRHEVRLTPSGCRCND
jgi:hypothetical protein